jgi:hypothetical protein
MPPSAVQAPIPVERIVDRDEQREIFEEAVAGAGEKRLIFVRADDGYGKTCLLRVLKEYCKDKALPCCYIEFKRTDSYDVPHLTLAREICEQLGIEPKHLCDKIRPLSASGGGGRASTEIAGDVTDSTVITQVLVNVSLTDESLQKGPVKQRLKRAFLQDLSTTQGPLICLFDALECISGEEETWLLETLLQPVLTGELEHVIVVTGGTRLPNIHVWEWQGDAHLIKDLPPLTEEHIQELGRRLGRELSQEEAHNIWQYSQEGIPLLVGIVTMSLLARGGASR